MESFFYLFYIVNDVDAMKSSS